MQLRLAVICVPGEREYERCRFWRISIRQGWRQFTYDRGSRSHEVGTVITVKIVKDSYDRNGLQWYVHGIYNTWYALFKRYSIVVIIVAVLTLTHRHNKMQFVVARQAPITLEWKKYLGKNISSKE